VRADFDWPQTKSELADLVEAMMGWQPFDKKFGWDVDNFEHSPFVDVELEAWRQRILREVWHLQFPSRGQYGDRIATDRAKTIIESLRNNEDA
jgi:hypothetical protein